MKQILYFLSFLTLFFLTKFSLAQTTPPPRDTTTIRHITTKIRSVKLDTNEIIYDENGNGLINNQSQKLLNTGEYTIRMDGRLGDPGVKKHLVKQTPAQQIAMYERIKPMIAINSPYLKEGQPLDVKPLLDALDKKDIDQKVIILVFWNVGCPPCTESFAALNDFFAQIHNPESITIVAITTDNSLLAAQKLKEKPLYNSKLISDARDIMSAYQLNNYPAFVVTDRDHIIRFATKGLSPVSLNAFKNCVRSVLYQ